MPDLQGSEEQIIRDAIRSAEQAGRAARWEWLEGKWYPVWLVALLGAVTFNAHDAFTSSGLVRISHALLALFFGGLAVAFLRVDVQALVQALKPRRRAGQNRASDR